MKKSKPKKNKKEVKKKPKEIKKSKVGKKAEMLMIKMNEIVAKGKKRGFITYDEILKQFPDIEDNILFLDELYEKLSVAGIDVLESGNLLDLEETDVKKISQDMPGYDSIQMYLKEIGQYPLIPASEEKELAKRIEA